MEWAGSLKNLLLTWDQMEPIAYLLQFKDKGSEFVQTMTILDSPLFLFRHMLMLLCFVIAVVFCDSSLHFALKGLHMFLIRCLIYQRCIECILHLFTLENWLVNKNAKCSEWLNNQLYCFRQTRKKTVKRS